MSLKLSTKNRFVKTIPVSDEETIILDGDLDCEKPKITWKDWLFWFYVYAIGILTGVIFIWRFQ